MRTGLFAGLDVSTQSCKIVVLDVSAEEVVYVDTVNYDEDLPQFGTKNGIAQGLEPGISESNPKMWLEAVEKIFEGLRNSDIPQHQIRSISVSGQQHGLVSLDEMGNLTRSRSKLWNDFSTADECEILNEEVGGNEAMIREVGNKQKTGYTAAKILHMFRNEKELYQKTKTFFIVHNYINWYLTGGKKGGIRIMEPGDTSGMALWNPKTGNWSKKVVDSIDTGLFEKLPPVRPSDKSIGCISQELADKYGFSPHCKIDAGCGDNMYGAIGTGNVESGIVTISLGTSGTAYSFMENPYIDPTGEVAAYCDSTGHYLPVLCVSNLANGYDHLLEKYNLSHDDFNKIIQKTRAGNSGRMLIPWYTGERTPDLPQATPVYFGFGLDDFNKEILCRAVLEGHVLNLYNGFQRMPVEPKEVRLTGGLSKSEAWNQMIADVFEAEAVPVVGEGAALGAALHAAWVWFKESGESYSIKEIVDPFVTLDESKRKKPIKANIEVYKIQKQLFHALSSRLQGQEGEDPFSLRIDLSTI